jgi:hypothetical protein
MPGDFYTNCGNPHVKNHGVTSVPRKHGVVVVVILFTQGIGKHEVDVETFTVETGCILRLYCRVINDIIGNHPLILMDLSFSNSREFFDKGLISLSIKDLAFL